MAEVRGLRLAAVAIIRNESDIFEAFVRANLALLDRMYIALHRPTDGTTEIAHALAREGLDLHLFEDPIEGFFQAARVNQLTRLAFAEGADFVFPLDGDELLQADHRIAMEHVLRRLPDGYAGALRLLTYVPCPRDDIREPVPTRRIRHRFDIGPSWAESAPRGLDVEYARLVVGRWFAAHPGARIYEGNHAVIVGNKVHAVACPGIEVAHFPVRSLAQLTNKARTGWPAYLSTGRDVVSERLGTHWRFLHERYLEKTTLDWEDAREFIRWYLPPALRDRPVIESPITDRIGRLRYGALRRA